jgi:hypothetical protein
MHTNVHSLPHNRIDNETGTRTLWQWATKQGIFFLSVIEMDGEWQIV